MKQLAETEAYKNFQPQLDKVDHDLQVFPIFYWSQHNLLPLTMLGQVLPHDSKWWSNVFFIIRFFRYDNTLS